MRSARIVTRRATRVAQLVQALPAELLCMIFEYLAKQHVEWNLKWILVTHVCRRWRSIAIEHRVLWTTLHTRRLPAWEAFAQRAQELPLKIVHRYITSARHRKDPSQAEIGEAILSRIPRATSLVSEYSDCVNQDFLARVAACEKLHTFALRTHGALYYPAGYPLPSFGPNLRVLELSGVLFPFNSIRAPCIRELVLQVPLKWGRLSEKTEHGSSAFLDLLDTLRGMEFLEALHILRVVPPPPSNLKDNEAMKHHVELPRLRHLCLKGIVSGCAKLWAFLHFPVPASVLIQVQESWDLNPTDLSLFCQSLRDRLSRTPVHEYSNPEIIDKNECWDSYRRRSDESDFKKVILTIDGPGNDTYLQPQVKGSGVYLEIPGLLVPDGVARRSWNSFPITAAKLLESLPTELLEALTVRVDDVSSIELEGVFKHATIKKLQ